MKLCIAPAVQQALHNNKPVVALESTLISHGLPFPYNRDLALELEKIVADNGATPATIAVIHGNIHIGLSYDDITLLATAKDILKLSASDIPFCVAQKKTGATTVAATLFCAASAGIRVFATGGIGGVHRGAEHSFDISQDLTALRQYPVAVVCAGAKSILDLPKTLEYLETLGVPIIGYDTQQFPSFWSRTCGLPLKWSVTTAQEAALHINTLHQHAETCGCIIANPIPTEAAIDNARIDEAIAHALIEAERDQIHGSDITPYMLRKIRDLLPETLDANIALLKHNAKIAALIAAAL